MLEPETVEDLKSVEGGVVETKEASDDSDNDEEEKADEVGRDEGHVESRAEGMEVSTAVEEYISQDNRCDLLWRGVLPKRSFPGFKFQECKSAVTARKLLEAKGVAHYWDMAYHADDMLEVAKI